jgi:hypothetical protein
VQDTDIGNVQEHTLSVFTVTVCQYWPAQTAADEDSVLVSRLRFANAPGAERLAMEAEVLRIREGPSLNRSLLTFAAALRALQNSSKAETIDTSASTMTRLLADSLGGNALSLMIATLRQGEWQVSEAVLRHVQVRCPCVTASDAKSDCSDARAFAEPCGQCVRRRGFLGMGACNLCPAKQHIDSVHDPPAAVRSWQHMHS